MKSRTIHTFKLLAVAATAAGCTKTVGPEVSAEVQIPAPAQPVPETAAPPAAAPQPAVAQQAAAAPTHVDTPPATADRPIPPLPPEQREALLTLAGQLEAAGPQSALQQMARFRPLCDKDGYPLVGNVMGKGHHGRPYLPSTFCAEVRKKAQP